MPRAWKYHLDIRSAIEEAGDQELDAEDAGKFIAERLKREVRKLPENLRDEILDIAERLEVSEDIEEIDGHLQDLYNFADDERIWMDAKRDPRDWHPPRPGMGVAKRRPYRHIINMIPTIRRLKILEYEVDDAAELLEETLDALIPSLPRMIQRDFQEISDQIGQAATWDGLDNELEELVILAESERVLLEVPGEKEWSPRQRMEYFRRKD